MSLKGSNRSRLRQIEKAYKAGKSDDWITVTEDMDQPGVLRGKDKDGVERLWSEEELERLDASGVNIIRIIWTHEAEPEEDGS